jgi:hypothetical protein
MQQVPTFYPFCELFASCCSFILTLLFYPGLWVVTACKTISSILASACTPSRGDHAGSSLMAICSGTKLVLPMVLSSCRSSPVYQLISNSVHCKQARDGRKILWLFFSASIICSLAVQGLSHVHTHTRAPLWIKLSLVRVPLQCTKHDSCIYLLFFFFKHGGCFSLCVGYGAYGLFWSSAQFSLWYRVLVLNDI